MHHTNATFITDWALRRPGSQLHLLERYSTQYWSIVASVVMQCSLHDVAGMTESEDITVKTGAVARRVVCPLVSRHIDFLGNPPGPISYTCTLTHQLYTVVFRTY